MFTLMIDFTFILEELRFLAIGFAETDSLAFRYTSQLAIDNSIYGDWKCEMSACEVHTWQTTLYTTVWYVHEPIRSVENLAIFDQ